MYQPNTNYQKSKFENKYKLIETPSANKTSIMWLNMFFFFTITCTLVKSDSALHTYFTHMA